MWHDANAGALALVCFDALWVVADAGGLWRGDAGAVEVAGLGFPAARGYLLYAYARGSRGWFARGAVHGSTRGEDRAARHLWACWHELCARRTEADCARIAFSGTGSRVEKRRTFSSSW